MLVRHATVLPTLAQVLRTAKPVNSAVPNSSFERVHLGTEAFRTINYQRLGVELELAILVHECTRD